MTAINFNTLKCLPEEFLIELKSYDSFFIRERYFNRLLDNPAIYNLVQKLNQYCLSEKIIGFHYTRANPDEISTNGLICRTGNDIQDVFISKYHHLFTEVEKVKMKESWSSIFYKKQKELRDGLLYFNFTTYALKNGSAELLLSNYGGEQVYFPLLHLDKIIQKIKAIGKPLIIVCKLNPNNLKTFIENPWGQIAVSKYHCQLNSEASQIDQDGYQFVGVKPEDIELIECETQNGYDFAPKTLLKL